MTTETKPGQIDVYGIERCAESCRRVKKLLMNRPWVIGKIVETERMGEDDLRGIDMFVPAHNDLVEIMGLLQDPRGLRFQVKSMTKKENYFHHKHKLEVMNLGTGENIFVLNGQENYQMMLATLVGQMVVMAGLTGDVTEELMLSFLSENLGDVEAVETYLDRREEVICKKWFRGWLDGSKMEEWKQYEPTLVIIGE